MINPSGDEKNLGVLLGMSHGKLLLRTVEYDHVLGSLKKRFRIREAR